MFFTSSSSSCMRFQLVYLIVRPRLIDILNAFCQQSYTHYTVYVYMFAYIYTVYLFDICVWHCYRVSSSYIQDNIIITIMMIRYILYYCLQTNVYLPVFQFIIFFLYPLTCTFGFADNRNR